MSSKHLCKDGINSSLSHASLQTISLNIIIKITKNLILINNKRNSVLHQK